ncbi:AfsR/SARP family transcriptional regulator [Micromonospora halotolerans]|uniref:AfsR/SARP family transcriptional regulator n=1 Tax=Micromonospora halotolerans TaxID=709879 RepID=A0ABZ0A577_9ACTN|nr:AfsR/SARP family transcriptional regulator [Micromonospora halotolerans]WNM42542.1 AfsR/SARP family transcriptional regulator [Micromonospora halotolerans]
MSEALRFEILGPQRAWYADRPLDLGPGKQRAVLAVLLLAAGRPVPTGQIVDAVWPEEPPANGPNVVQKYVAGLRRVLEPDRSPRTPGQVLTLTDAGYLLRIPPEAVDAVRFERGVHRARQWHAAGRTEDALAEVTAVLERWQGEPFTGFAGPYFDAARHRLVELRAVALETRTELELAGGRHGELVGRLVELVAEFPVRERLRHQLMLALHRSGRQAEALAAYRDFADLLREEYGIEPGEALQGLHQRILRADPTLLPPSTPAAPAPTTAPPTPPAAQSAPTAAPPAPPAVPLAPPAAQSATAPAAAPPAPSAPEAVPAPRAGGAPDAGGPGLPDGSPAAAPGAAAVGTVPTASTRDAPGPAPAPTPTPPAPPGWGGAGPAAPIPHALLVAMNQPAEGPVARRAPGWVRLAATVVGTAGALLSFGALTWAVVLGYALWRRSWRLALAGLGYFLLVLSVFVLAVTTPENEEPTDGETLYFVIAMGICWLLGAAHVVLLNPALWAAIGELFWTGRQRTDEQRRLRREQARYLLHHYPAARAELRIGRPDLPRGYDDGGLVDVNAVPDPVLATLPGLTVDQRRQIAVDRWLRGPYGSLEELAGRCHLPPGATEPLRDVLLFLPPDPPPVRPSALGSPPVAW